MSQKQFEHREPFTERFIVKMTPGQMRRLYSKAAKEGRTASDITRQALAVVLGS